MAYVRCFLGYLRLLWSQPPFSPPPSLRIDSGASHTVMKHSELPLQASLNFLFRDKMLADLEFFIYPRLALNLWSYSPSLINS